MTALVVSGASVLMVLGVVHGALTLASKPTHGAFAATQADVQAAMQAPTGLGLAPDLDTTLWRAWIGFNLSHAVGLVVVAAAIMVPAVGDLDAATSQPLYLVLTLAVPAVYLVVSVRHWFARPTRAIAVGSALIAAGTLGSLLG